MHGYASVQVIDKFLDNGKAKPGMGIKPGLDGTVSIERLEYACVLFLRDVLAAVCHHK